MSTLTRGVFALLVLASFGAFFLTQRLKHTPTAIQAVKATASFDPYGCRAEERISFKVRQADAVTVTILDSRGDEIATLADDLRMHAYRQRTFYWSGRAGAGLAPDGTYRVRVRLRDQGRSVTLPRSFRLDAGAPRPRLALVSARRGGVTLGLDLDLARGGHDPRLLVYHGGEPLGVVPVPGGAARFRWSGVVAGRQLRPGVYQLILSVKGPRPAQQGCSAPWPNRSRPSPGALTVLYPFA